LICGRGGIGLTRMLELHVTVTIRCCPVAKTARAPLDILAEHSVISNCALEGVFSWNHVTQFGQEPTFTIFPIQFGSSVAARSRQSAQSSKESGTSGLSARQLQRDSILRRTSLYFQLNGLADLE
jgi:hypothetical protein